MSSVLHAVGPLGGPVLGFRDKGRGDGQGPKEPGPKS